ncbi:unnamed protein product [Prorocentrum cordatum]|uniref:Uncharacterized protein n=1 Tax=Prorocentrum cordatum TaxID=2364126 RepID=A0ABN9WVP3_9DINO|nr:unnamed protein product [Polarella glacialis]
MRAATDGLGRAEPHCRGCPPPGHQFLSVPAAWSTSPPTDTPKHTPGSPSSRPRLGSAPSSQAEKPRSLGASPSCAGGSAQRSSRGASAAAPREAACALGGGSGPDGSSPSPRSSRRAVAERSAVFTPPPPTSKARTERPASASCRRTAAAKAAGPSSPASGADHSPHHCATPDRRLAEGRPVAHRARERQAPR